MDRLKRAARRVDICLQKRVTHLTAECARECVHAQRSRPMAFPPRPNERFRIVANNAGCAISHRSDWATCARDTQKLRAQIKILTHNMMDDSEKVFSLRSTIAAAPPFICY
jgi:hypothetical protein